MKKQPVLVLLNIPDEDDLTVRERGIALENDLRGVGQDVAWCIPLSYTVEVPKGVLSVG